ncbi:MAG: glycosyltransferase [Lachnospiraceae bacterium]|nr:glycosyltransferase [Lachnospiraceae bacterium]
MNHVKVSVIIPFHNGINYVNETMRMIVNQTLKEIEIICVDDESTDGTFERLVEIAKTDERILVKQQKKANAGAARNLGMKHATGQYLMFLDSDDIYELDLVESLYDECERTRADIGICNADQYNVEIEEYIKKPHYLREKLLPDDMPFSLNDMGKYILYFTSLVPWNKMFRRQFILDKELAFQEIARANDQYFCIMSLIMAQRITAVKRILIHYKVHQQNNLTATFSKTPLCSYVAMTKVKEELDACGMLQNEDVRCAFDNKLLNLLLFSLRIQNDISAFYELYNTMKEEGFEKLGVTLRNEDYYFDSAEYRNLVLIMELTAQEYLFEKQREYRGTIERKNKQIAEKNAEIKALQKEESRLQKKEKELETIKNSKRYQTMCRVVGVWDRIAGKKKGNK